MGIIYICNHENNVPSPLSSQQFCGNSSTQVYDIRLHIFFLITCVYYAHLATVRSEHSTYRGSLMTTYNTLLAWLAEHSLAH